MRDERCAEIPAHAIHEAVGFAAKTFLHADSWEDAIDEILTRLGLAADASRAALLENRSDASGQTYVALRAEWTAPGLASNLDIPPFKGFARQLEEYDVIADTLARGEPFRSRVSELPSAVREGLSTAGTKSILLVPIPVEGSWWGTLGLDDSVVERMWSETEVEALRVAADMVGATVERRRMTEAVERRDAILEAVAFASESFLQAASWETAVAQVLPRLGRAAVVSRVYIFENRRAEDGTLLMSARHEWTDELSQPHIVDPGLEDLLLFPQWEERLARGEIVDQTIRELPFEHRSIIVATDVRSTLIVPIVVEGEWIGEISFDDCVEERAWSAGEVEALRVAAGTLAAAIERSRAGRELERQAHFLGQVHDAAVATDADGVVKYWNRGAERLYGYTADEAIGRRIGELLYPSRAQADELSTAVAMLRLDLEVVNLETARRRKDGSLVDVEISLSPTLDADGELAGFVAIARDIGERNRSDAALRRRDAILEAVGFAAERLLGASSLDDAIDDVLARLGIATDVSRVVLFETEQGADGEPISMLRQEWSARGFEPIRGRPEIAQGVCLWGEQLARGEVVARHARDYSAEERAVLEPQGAKSILSVPIIVGDQWWGDIGFGDCVREHDWTDVEIDALHAAAGIIGATIARDRAESELHMREEQFQHAQKSETLGRLAGAIAHDFNNVLTVIAGFGDLLRTSLDSDALRADADEIVKAASRGQALTQQLLSFSRRRVAQPRLVDLNEVVRDIERMLERLLDRRITLQTNLDAELGAVRADVSQVEQVLVNLAVNARDAMHAGPGTLTIATRNVVISDGDEGAPDGSYVELSVTDTGHGMDEGTRLRVFEPFFTTKTPEQGTGLGLATVTDIVSQYRGSVTVSSSPDDGTTFRILFPRA